MSTALTALFTATLKRSPGKLTAPSAASATTTSDVSGLQVYSVHTVFQIHTLFDLLSDLLLSLSAHGSHPPSYVRWIPSTIIYPLDPFLHHISVGSYPPGSND
jgi:hypothetical protein